MGRTLIKLLFLPTLAWNVLLCRVSRSWNWWDRIDDHVLLGALPFAKDVQSLHDSGVRAVINLCDEYGGPAKTYENAGIEQLHLPTVDFHAPSLVAIRRGVSFIDEHVQNGNTVYVHCKAGRGRSATLAMCWLIQDKSMTPVEAQTHLQQKRHQTVHELYCRDVVQQFYKLQRT